MSSLSDLYSLGVVSITLFLAVFWLLIFFDINMGRKRGETEKGEISRKVAVLIPTLAEGAELRKAVKTVMSSDYPKRMFRTYIVLNKSSPEYTRKIAYSMMGSRVKVIDAPMNGKAAVMNYALKNFVKEELLLVLDADTMVARDLIRRLVRPFKNRKVASVVSSVKVYRPKRVIERLQAYEYMFSIMARKAMSVLGGLMVVHGAGSMFRVSSIRKVGYFDPNNYTEDIEIGLRLLTSGYLVENDINSFSYTIVPNTIRGLVRQRFRWFSGFIINIIKYRKKIERGTYSILGRVIVPISLVSISLGVVVAAGLAYYFMSLAAYLYSVAANTSLYYALASAVQLSVFSLNTVYIAMIALAFVGLFSLFYSLRSINGRLDALKDTVGILIYSIFYSFFLSFIWLGSLAMLPVRRNGVGWSIPT